MPVWPDFPYPSRLVLGSTQSPAQGRRLSFRGVKRPGHVVYHPSQSSVEVKEYSCISTSLLDLRGLFRVNFTFFFFNFMTRRYTKENYLQKIKLALCLVIKSRCLQSFLLWQWEASGQFSTPCELLDLILKLKVPANERTPRCLTRVYLTSCSRHVTAPECVMWWLLWNIQLAINFKLLVSLEMCSTYLHH